MTRKIFGGTRTAALAALLVSAAALAMTAAPARAMQILEAADHGELAAEVSAAGVSRIALGGDRIKRVIRAPGGFAVEHDPESGDLYLRPVAPELADGGPVTLFIGTERGFTYRLTLTPAVRDSAQILIRNADAASAAMAGRGAGASDPRVAALVRLVRAVARREVLPGYAIVPGGGEARAGLTVIETWRGPRLAAHQGPLARRRRDHAQSRQESEAGARLPENDRHRRCGSPTRSSDTRRSGDAGTPRRRIPPPPRAEPRLRRTP